MSAFPNQPLFKNMPEDADLTSDTPKGIAAMLDLMATNKHKLAPDEQVRATVLSIFEALDNKTQNAVEKLLTKSTKELLRISRLKEPITFHENPQLQADVGKLIEVISVTKPNEEIRVINSKKNDRQTSGFQQKWETILSLLGFNVPGKVKLITWQELQKMKLQSSPVIVPRQLQFGEKRWNTKKPPHGTTVINNNPGGIINYLEEKNAAK